MVRDIVYLLKIQITHELFALVVEGNLMAVKDVREEDTKAVFANTVAVSGTLKWVCLRDVVSSDDTFFFFMNYPNLN